MDVSLSPKCHALAGLATPLWSPPCSGVWHVGLGTLVFTPPHAALGGQR